MSAEQVTLHVDGLAIAGEIHLPVSEHSTSHFPCLILCHGIPAGPYDPSDRSYAQLAERTTGLGFAVFIFNFRGAGLSQGNFDILGWAHDLHAAIDYVHEREEIDRRLLFVLGSSAGAAVSVYVAAHDPRVSALACLACPARFGVEKGDANRLLDQSRRVGIIKDPAFPPSVEEWRANFREVSPIRWIDRVSPRPLLLIHGEQDELIPVGQASALFDKAKDPKELVLLPGLGHRLRREEKPMQVALERFRRLSSTT
ncbi:MAG: alpha/beta fold hydrolase [Chloroflexi bacterium]|nr:alpha/beta fold hydrolase [Chloroflexota bacterium]